VGPGHAFARIEVEDHPVGQVDPAGDRVPGVELDRVHLRSAQQGVDAVDRQQRCVPRP
jgi:hypothetical protein